MSGQGRDRYISNVQEKPPIKLIPLCPDSERRKPQRFRSLFEVRTKNVLSVRALSAIFQQDIDLPFEVIVIDSGSTDRTLDIVRRHAVRLYEIEAREFSYGRALNLGAKLAEGRYLINLSAHCIPTSDRWITNLVKDLRPTRELPPHTEGRFQSKD